MFRSTVIRTSKPAPSANVNNSPLPLPPNPARRAGLHSCSRRLLQSFCGTHSSRKNLHAIRSSNESLALSKALTAISRVTPWKVVQELIESLPAFQIIQQCLERHASATKAWRAAHDLWIADDDGLFRHLTTSPQLAYEGSVPKLL